YGGGPSTPGLASNHAVADLDCYKLYLEPSTCVRGPLSTRHTPCDIIVAPARTAILALPATYNGLTGSRNAALTTSHYIVCSRLRPTCCIRLNSDVAQKGDCLFGACTGG